MRRDPSGADPCCARPGVPAPAAMRIGDLVTYQGTLYVLCGLDPMSVPERRVELEHPHTGERIRVPLAEVDEDAEEPQV